LKSLQNWRGYFTPIPRPPGAGSGTHMDAGIKAHGIAFKGSCEAMFELVAGRAQHVTRTVRTAHATALR
jgi:hypothetical protein